MLTIENTIMKACFREKGAELSSFYNKSLALELLWQGDPAFWGKQSPVLFPIVGALKDNQYAYKGETYQMGRHGFARDKQFKVVQHHDDQITFLLQHDEETLQIYPFEFDLYIHYKLFAQSLIVTYKIANPSESKDLYATIGAHPAFNLPVEKYLEYNDYTIYFEEEEDAVRYPIDQHGLLKLQGEPALHKGVLPLSKELFFNDALVFKHLRSETLEIRSARSEHGLSVDFGGFDYLGIWAAKNADFVCIEPWCGVADSVNSQHVFEQKEGMQKIAPKESFSIAWSVTSF